MKRVLIVDDSPVARELLVHILSKDQNLEIIGTARDGLEALEKVAQLLPDVIVMDINMPRMDGFAATKEIMSTKAVPIVIVSAIWDPDNIETTFRAVEAGAIAVVRKPPGPHHPDHIQQANELLQTVRTMSEVRVITRHHTPVHRPEVEVTSSTERPPIPRSGHFEVVAIGASTGGPMVLRTILSALPSNFRAPILVVQHIATGFLDGMLDWLSRSTTLTLHVAANGQAAQPGHVYFGPNGFHLGIDRHRRLTLTRCDPQSRLCPSVAYLFDSVLASFGHHAVGVLLTGMGKDGAAELRKLRNAGAVTIAQDAQTSVVYGMPGEAAALDAAAFVLPDTEIASRLFLTVGAADRYIPREETPTDV